MSEDSEPVVKLFPAIDLRRGRCVRLQQGAPDRETVYQTDPFLVARQFVDQGAEWLHVVDLDAAFGEGSNRTLIRSLAEATPVRIQTGGGLRREEDLVEVLESAVARAIIGTAAIERPDLVRLAVERWGGERIAVGLDARGGRLAVKGWQEETGADVIEVAERLVEFGLRTFIHTDIARDGMLGGPNLAASIELAEKTGAEVIVSGGVGSLQDLATVRDAARTHPGIVGVIVGKALYEGKFGVAEAIEVLK